MVNCFCCDDKSHSKPDASLITFIVLVLYAIFLPQKETASLLLLKFWYRRSNPLKTFQQNILKYIKLFLCFIVSFFLL